MSWGPGKRAYPLQSTQCPRCLELIFPNANYIHTCSPTPEWLALESERNALRAQVEKLTEALQALLDDSDPGRNPVVIYARAALAKVKGVEC